MGSLLQWFYCKYSRYSFMIRFRYVVLNVPLNLVELGLMHTKKATSHNLHDYTPSKPVAGVAASWFQKHFNAEAPAEYGVLHQRRASLQPSLK